MNDVHDAKRLRELQALPLWRKIQITQTRILEWGLHYNGQIYVSFSGGKDSTVLLDLTRRIFPDTKAVFVNTGLEYPEIRKFALSHENVEELRPRWGRNAKDYGHKPGDIITFHETVSIYGYPIISKAVSNAIGFARSKPGGSRWARLHGEYKRKDGAKKSQYDYSRYLPLYHLPIRISDVCCKISKKGPAHKYQRETGLKPIIATMASESLIRKQAWIDTGCNAFNSSEPISKPMSFWLEQDVLAYIKRFDVPIASVYGDVVTSDEDGFDYNILMGDCQELHCTGCRRTGCIFCAYGAHLEKGESRFQRLAKTHPQLYAYCIGGGQWIENENYNPAEQSPDIWNPPRIWVPSKQGLGMGKVFDMVNEIYGKDFIRYE